MGITGDVYRSEWNVHPEGAGRDDDQSRFGPLSEWARRTGGRGVGVRCQRVGMVHDNGASAERDTLSTEEEKNIH